jgi:xylulose-5-phosphate/fructose-6-phosphate phosphoketolase
VTVDERPTNDTRTTEVDLALVDAYWRAANYLSVGQIYLVDNPLLTEPLRPEHVKPRLLGHWAPRRGSTCSTRTSTG